MGAESVALDSVRGKMPLERIPLGMANGEN
jgi:hypothetical protein